jgi:hypothetical protein
MGGLGGKNSHLGGLGGKNPHLWGWGLESAKMQGSAGETFHPGILCIIASIAIDDLMWQKAG